MGWVTYLIGQRLLSIPCFKFSHDPRTQGDQCGPVQPLPSRSVSAPSLLSLLINLLLFLLSVLLTFWGPRDPHPMTAQRLERGERELEAVGCGARQPPGGKRPGFPRPCTKPLRVCRGTGWLTRQRWRVLGNGFIDTSQHDSSIISSPLSSRPFLPPETDAFPACYRLRQETQNVILGGYREPNLRPTSHLPGKLLCC